MILLWGLPADPPMADVLAALSGQETDFTFLDQRSILSTQLHLNVRERISGRIRSEGTWIDLDEVGAAYVRPCDSGRVPDVARDAKDGPARVHALAFDQHLLTWADQALALVVNKPSASFSNDCKPYQAAIIRRCGLLSPETLITTDPELAREFIARHRVVVYKSISSVRSIVSRVGDEQRSRLDDVRWCPTQFQQYVAGTDHRVHVVGDELFAVEIVSDADDYRYAASGGKRCEMTPTEIPREIADACRRVSSELGLAFSGIDLRCTPDGVWYCFEVNPSPGFSFFDTESHDIAHAVADLLTQAA